MTKKYELCALGKSRDLKKSHYKSDIGTKKRLKTIVELTNNIEFNIYEGNPIFTLGKENRFTISKEDNIATVVNVFSVQPQNQQKFIEI